MILKTQFSSHHRHHRIEKLLATNDNVRERVFHRVKRAVAHGMRVATPKALIPYNNESHHLAAITIILSYRISREILLATVLLSILKIPKNQPHRMNQIVMRMMMTMMRWRWMRLMWRRKRMSFITMTGK